MILGDKPELPDRLFLEAILYRARTGTPWRDLPDVFDDWNAVCQRCKRWRLAGVWDRLFDTLPTDDATAEVRRLFVDSTTIRAHPHAAGAKKKDAEAEDALGRSRGGYTTKVHLACTDEDTAVAIALTPGQASDAPQFDGLFITALGFPTLNARTPTRLFSCKR